MAKSAAHPAPVKVSSSQLTRQRILEAAEKVFARDGFHGATTRGIAHEAGVNEVTLFRHFRTRSELLHETILHGPMDVEELVGSEAAWKADLHGEMERYVRRYYERLLEREALVRAVVSEGTLLPPELRRALHEKKIAPIRLALVKRLETARKNGHIRPDVDLGCAVDALRDSLHAGMLRNTTYGGKDYSVATYLGTVAKLFMSGIRKS